jgi:hypothetical protein
MFISILHDIVLDRILCYCAVLARGRLAIGVGMVKQIRKAMAELSALSRRRWQRPSPRVFRAVGENIALSMPAEMAAKGLVEQLLEPVPGIEGVHDIVARALIDEGYSKEAKA